MSLAQLCPQLVILILSCNYPRLKTVQVGCYLYGRVLGIFKTLLIVDDIDTCERTQELSCSLRIRFWWFPLKIWFWNSGRSDTVRLGVRYSDGWSDILTFFQFYFILSICLKEPMWVFKQANWYYDHSAAIQKKYESALRKCPKLLKSVHPIIMTKFLRVLVNFLVQQTQIFFPFAPLWSWFKCGVFEYPHRVLSSNLNVHFC